MTQTKEEVDKFQEEIENIIVSEIGEKRELVNIRRMQKKIRKKYSSFFEISVDSIGLPEFKYVGPKLWAVFSPKIVGMEYLPTVVLKELED